MNKHIYDINSIDVLDRKPKGDKFRLIDDIVRQFISEFKYQFPSTTTPKKGLTRWLVKEKNFPKMRNILIFAIEESFKREDLRYVAEESEKKVEEMKNKVDELIATAKQDLAYLRNEVAKKVDEDIKYG